MKKNSKGIGLNKIAVGLAILIVITLLVVFLLTSKEFDINIVSISGNTIWTDEEIAAKVKKNETNIFLFSKSKLSKELLSMQGIKNVKIKKSLPNRLNITIEESYIMGKTTQNPTYYIDNDGFIRQDIRKSVINDHKVLPISLPTEYINLDKKFSDDVRNIEVLKILFISEISELIDEVNFDKSYNIDIMIKDIRVRFGPADNIYEKVSNLTAVLKKIAKDNIKAAEIILNAGKNPIVVLKKN